jgi:hypothetical protein
VIWRPDADSLGKKHSKVAVIAGGHQGQSADFFAVEQSVQGRPKDFVVPCASDPLHNPNGAATDPFAYQKRRRALDPQSLAELNIASDDKRKNAVRSWIFEHSGLIAEIDPVLSGVSPETAIAVFRRGGSVNLGGHNGSDWHLQTWALARIAQVDSNAARSILLANERHVVDGLSKMQGIDVQELPAFLALSLELERPGMTRFLDAIDLKSASEHWPRLLKERAQVQGKAKQVLTIISEHSHGKTKQLAESILATTSSDPSLAETRVENGTRRQRRKH